MLSFLTNFRAIIALSLLVTLTTVVAASNPFAPHFGNFSGSEDGGQAKAQTGQKDTVTYIRASTPFQIFQCTQKLTLLRCLKLFLLQRMTGHSVFPNSGNVTKDFLDQIMRDERSYPSLLDKKYTRIDDKQLTEILVECFQKFFKDREIKLHFIPGVMVRVIPSNENRIKLSLRRGFNSLERKHKTYKSMLQLAVPIILMPAVLMGTVLPFILPAIKLAAIMTTIINNGALLAALMYAARSTNGNTDEHMVHYSHPGYH